MPPSASPDQRAATGSRKRVGKTPRSSGADPDLVRLLMQIQKIAELPSSAARSLPPEAYTSSSLLQLEREKIFRKEWICVGRADEIPECGDFFTTQIDAVPLIIVRRNDREIGALVNVCRHHFTPVASGEGNTRRFICPYHAWTYDLDGRLIAAPRMPEAHAATLKDCRLPEVRTELWAGFIYANLDDHARPLAPRLEGLDRLIGNYHVERMNTVWHKQHVWKTNWKILTENFIEAYHIPATHRETLLPFAPTEDVDMLPGGEGYCFYRNRMRMEPVPLAPEIRVDNPDLTEHELNNAYIGGVFPTHVFSVAWDWIFWLSLQPEGTGRVALDWGVGGPVYLPKNQPEYPDFPYPALVERINEEDRIRIEGVQRGAESGFAQQGPLSEHEQPIWRWLQYFAARLAE